MLKKLFINISKIIYKEYIEGKIIKTNSSLNVYESNNFILENAQES